MLKPTPPLTLKDFQNDWQRLVIQYPRRVIRLCAAVTLVHKSYAHIEADCINWLESINA